MFHSLLMLIQIKPHRLHRFEKWKNVEPKLAQFAKRQNLIVIISLERDNEMMSKGLIKDLARRIQTLRKEKGFNPTDILERASILELDEESLNLIKDKTEDIAFLVRVKNVDFTESCKNYKDDDIDGLKIRIAVE